MKTLLTSFVFLFLGLSTYCQQIPGEITVASNFFGNRYYQGDKKISMRQLIDIMESNPEAHKKIRSASATQTLAGILGAAGGALIGFPIGTSMGGGEPNWTLAAIGAGLVVVTIPISLSANKKTKSAVDIYNEGLRSTSTGFNLKFRMESNQLGFVLQF